MDLQRAESLVWELLGQHNLVEHGWRFEWMRAKSKLGMCRYFLKTIYLSKPVTMVNDEAAVRNTILHEIAHALVGPSHGHDYVWKAKAIEIGCNGERTGQITDYQKMAKYKYSAPCGSTFFTNRRLQNLEHRFCRCCHGKITLIETR